MTPEIGYRVPAVLESGGAQKGEELTGLYAAAACLATLCLSGAALAQSTLPTPIRDTGTRGAPGDSGARGAIGVPGVVVRYEESAGAGIVYLEEAGSMLSTIPAPVKPTKAPARAPADPAGKAPAVAEVAPSRPAAPKR